jgi:hypothetical protein
MPLNRPENSVTIRVQSGTGRLVQFELSRRMLRRCPAINAMSPGTILLHVQVKPFQAVASYLDSDNSLSAFNGHVNSNAFLLLFAQTWALAARLGLPKLQNELISFMTNIHAKIVGGKDTGLRLQQNVDVSLVKAFQHLQKQVGRNSEAEKFLICFAGRTAPLIGELEQTLNNEELDPDIQRNVLTEARSFGPDPIKHHPEAFLVNLQKPPRYRPLELHRNEVGLAIGSWLYSEPSRSIIEDAVHTPRLPQIHVSSNNIVWPKSPKPTYPPLRTQHPDDPYPGYPSQTIYSDELNSPIDNAAGNLQLAGQGPGRSPSPPRPRPRPRPSSPPISSSSWSPPSFSPSPTPPPFTRCRDRDARSPYIIQIMQHNSNDHDNGNHIHNGDRNTAIAKVQDGSGRGNRTVRAVAGSGGRGYKLIKEKQGKRWKWFSLLTWGSKHY